MIEICCGSYEDALSAYKGGAKQIELNAGLALGGLTPSLASLQRVKKETDLRVIAMVRPRGGGFFYSQAEIRIMLADSKIFLENGADGIAFGFLTPTREIDLQRTQEMVELIHSYGKEAVFHRAIDLTTSYHSAIESLIDLKVDRILTSGQMAKVTLGNPLISQNSQRYNHQVDFLYGGGINAHNALSLAKAYGLKQIHSSCKDYIKDPTTASDKVSYAFLPEPYTLSYDTVSSDKVKQLIATLSGVIEP